MWRSDLILWVGWNTLLAAIPVVLGYSAYYLCRPSFASLSGWRKALALLLGAVWLFFLPNTCYLLTEWRHFLEILGYAQLMYRWQVDSGATVDLMILTLFFLCYSGIGVFTFTLGIRPVARLFRQAGANLWVWGLPLFLLNSVGVYLGLVLRFNSWDMVARLGEVWTAAAMILHRPVLASFILAFAGFLWIAFAMVDIWIDGLIMRAKQIGAR
jgi:uncharacterized membrane protein